MEKVLGIEDWVSKILYVSTNVSRTCKNIAAELVGILVEYRGMIFSGVAILYSSFYFVLSNICESR